MVINGVKYQKAMTTLKTTYNDYSMTITSNDLTGDWTSFPCELPGMMQSCSRSLSHQPVKGLDVYRLFPKRHACRKLHHTSAAVSPRQVAYFTFLWNNYQWSHVYRCNHVWLCVCVCIAWQHQVRSLPASWTCGQYTQYIWHLDAFSWHSASSPLKKFPKLRSLQSCLTLGRFWTQKKLQVLLHLRRSASCWHLQPL